MTEHNRVREYIKDNDVYLFGLMGSGKTTLVENIRQTTNVNYVSMGEITRNAIANADPEVTELIQRGGKLSLSAIRKLITPHIDIQSSYILDGVPRHPDEAEWIHDHAKKRAFGSVALTLLADESTVMDRIKHRAEMGSRTETPERIAARLDVYKTNQRAILKTLEPVLHDVIELDTTDLSPDEVFEKFNRRI